MTADFAAATNAMRLEKGAYALRLPPAWMQGRTVYGGASAAAALAAVMAAEPDLPPLRSAQAAFAGPLGEELEIRPALLRRGRSAVFMAAQVLSGGALGLAATFLFAAERDSHVDHPPEPRAQLPKRGDPIEVPKEVAFVGNFELARAVPSLGAGPAIHRWVRLRQRAGLSPLVELLLVADALPPAAMKLFKRPGPISTMTWQLNLLTPAPQTQDGWWLLSASASMAQAGFSSQEMQIWNSAGDLVATATQSIALFA